MIDYWQFHMFSPNLILIFNDENTPTHTSLSTPPASHPSFPLHSIKQLFSNFKGQGLSENRLLVSNLSVSDCVGLGWGQWFWILTNTQVLVQLLVQVHSVDPKGTQGQRPQLCTFETYFFFPPLGSKTILKNLDFLEKYLANLMLFCTYPQLIFPCV